MSFTRKIVLIISGLVLLLMAGLAISDWYYWSPLVYVVGGLAAVIGFGLCFLPYIWFPLAGGATDHPWVAVNFGFAGLINLFVNWHPYWHILLCPILWTIGVITLIILYHVREYRNEHEPDLHDPEDTYISE